jgi:photosystem I subunit 3
MQAFARDVAPYAGLTPCKKNAAFKKREKNELKAGTDGWRWY